MHTAVFVVSWLRCARVLCVDELKKSVGEEPLAGIFTTLGQGYCGVDLSESTVQKALLTRVCVSHSGKSLRL